MVRTPRIYTTEAVVLKTRRMGEADAVLTLLAADRGKFDAVARGIRKPTSRKSGHLEPLTHSTLLLAHGTNLDIITQAQTIHTFLPMRESLHRLGGGLYTAELLDRFTVEREESYAVFRLLVDTLSRLSTDADIDLTLRYYEARLLQESGFRPQLHQCVTCGEPLQPVVNFFSVAGGGMVCPACRPAGSGLPAVSVNALKVLRLMLHAEFADVARLRLSDQLLSEIEALLRLAVHRQLEREPRSLQFLRELRRPYNAGRENPAATSPVL
jgi:DNA repair protein RecO (recombination protein O)